MKIAALVATLSLVAGCAADPHRSGNANAQAAPSHTMMQGMHGTPEEHRKHMEQKMRAMHAPKAPDGEHTGH
jgi:hypothetical protein